MQLSPFDNFDNNNNNKDHHLARFDLFNATEQKVKYGLGSQSIAFQESLKLYKKNAPRLRVVEVVVVWESVKLRKIRTL